MGETSSLLARVRILLPALCAAALLPSAGRSADVMPLMKEAASEVLRKGAPGVSMAVVLDGRMYYWNAGESGRKGLAVTDRTLFETASITKVFTTTLLGIDVARGAKSLNDPVAAYMPGYPLRPRMRAATLEMLGTFTAGLPEAPPDYSKLPEDARGLGDYSVARFLRFVNGWQPARRLPAPRSYADASVGLLGLCLGNLRLGTWERRLETEIFEPLGMRDTVLKPNAEQERRLARGEQQPNGAIAPRWKVDAMAPSDGIKSTAFDLAQFLAASLGENEGAHPDLDAGMAIAVQTGFMVRFHNGREFQGLAWRSDPVTIGHRNFWIVTKSGDVPGFSSKISFCRDLGAGVAILANAGQLDLSNLEFDLIKRLALAR